MDLGTMEEAVNDANSTIKNADYMTGRMARILAGRLRAGRVNHYVLVKLKRELAKYNMNTKTWKD